MDYRVLVTKALEDDLVIIDMIFHELQDYENKLF